MDIVQPCTRLQGHTSLTVMTSLLLLLLVCLTKVQARIHKSQHQPIPTFSLSSQVLSSSRFMESLRHHGAVVFTDLGEEYTAAVARMKEKAPSCLDGALQVHIYAIIKITFVFFRIGFLGNYG